jgi:hypothetical protein
VKRRLRINWYDLILVIALASTVCYIIFYTKIPSNSPWIGLWANLTTDLFIVWLAGRVIDGIIRRRQRRQDVIQGTRGGTNYIMRIVANAFPWPSTSR